MIPRTPTHSKRQDKARTSQTTCFQANPVVRQVSIPLALVSGPPRCQRVTEIRIVARGSSHFQSNHFSVILFWLVPFFPWAHPLFFLFVCVSLMSFAQSCASAYHARSRDTKYVPVSARTCELCMTCHFSRNRSARTLRKLSGDCEFLLRRPSWAN